ncbi:MAG TPA: surface-adhesin E family protein [Allosphingosinicella sp.]|nr:surface-adhesin E family protein [Allosphingosinicella sp.]
MIGRIFAIALGGLAAAVPAQAENWRASSSDGNASAFIDADSIRRDGDQVSFRRELRWPEVRMLGNRLRYNRLLAHYEGDCRAMTLRSISIAAKLDDEVVLSGEGSGEIEQARPGSTAEVDMRSACFGEWPAGR